MKAHIDTLLLLLSLRMKSLKRTERRKTQTQKFRGGEEGREGGKEEEEEEEELALAAVCKRVCRQKIRNLSVNVCFIPGFLRR